MYIFFTVYRESEFGRKSILFLDYKKKEGGIKLPTLYRGVVDFPPNFD